MQPPSIGPALTLSVVLASCAVAQPGEPTAVPPEAVDPDRVTMSITCGGPGFPVSVLDDPGGAEGANDPAAEALRRHLGTPGLDIEWLPDSGWKVALRTDGLVVFVADALPGSESPLVQVSVEQRDGAWSVAGWGQCWPQADVGPGFGLASFRVAPRQELTADASEIDVLVTERACNSGQDARGRIVEPAIIEAPQSVTVVFAVRPRDGAHTCPSSPETPFVLQLSEPLGDRALLDGSEVPARDATTCPGIAMCP